MICVPHCCLHILWCQAHCRRVYNTTINNIAVSSCIMPTRPINLNLRTLLLHLTIVLVVKCRQSLVHIIVRVLDFVHICDLRMLLRLVLALAHASSPTATFKRELPSTSVGQSTPPTGNSSVASGQLYGGAIHAQYQPRTHT